tara:strand:+ start:860 stop:1333 length:474 start_codon:yes stop_codon:yes gene_type:complete
MGDQYECEDYHQDYNEYEHIIFDDYKIHTYNSDDEEIENENENLPDAWISNNQDKILKIYEDIKGKSYYNGLLGNLKFPDLCQYLDTNEFEQSHYFMKWFRKCAQGPQGHLSFQQFCVLYEQDIYNLYNDLKRNSYDWGTFEIFSGFIYEFTNTCKN